MRLDFSKRKLKKKMTKKKSSKFHLTVNRILLNQRIATKIKKIKKSLKIRISLKKPLSIINRYEIRKESLK